MKKLFISAIVALATVVGGVVPAAQAAPANPTNFVVVPGSNPGEITVSWDTVAGETYHIGYFQQNSGASSYGNEITTTTSPYTFTGLASGTVMMPITYQFGIWASLSDNTRSGWTDNWTGVQPALAIGTPSNISGQSAGQSAGDLYVSWTAATNASGYKIYYSTTDLPLSDAGWQSAGTSTYSSKVISGLNSASTYFVKIVPTFSGSDYTGSKSSSAFAPSAGMQTLAAPTGLAVTSPMSGRLGVSWNPVNQAMDYVIYTSTSQAGPWSQAASTMATSFTLSGLNASTALWVKVAARDGMMSAGTGAVSSSAVTPNGGGGGSAPGAIATFTAENTNVSGQIRLTWTAASNATVYDVLRSTAANGTFSSVGTLTGLTRTYVLLDPTIAYYYKIQPFNGVTAGTATAVVGPVYADGLGVAQGGGAPTIVFNQPKFEIPAKLAISSSGKVSLTGKDMGVTSVVVGGKEQKIDVNSTSKLDFETTGLTDGVHDLVMKGAFGTYTIQKAIQVGAPVVTKVYGLSSRTVDLAGGELSISGVGLEGTTQITMNGQILEIVSKGDSKVTFKVPASTLATKNNSILIAGTFAPVLFKNAVTYTK